MKTIYAFQCQAFVRKACEVVDALSAIPGDCRSAQTRLALNVALRLRDDLIYSLVADVEAEPVTQPAEAV